MPQNSSFSDKFSCYWVRGFLLKEGVKDKKAAILPLFALIVWKRLQIGTDLLHIITSTNDGLFRLVNINDLKRPWTHQKGILVNFAQFLDAAHILTLNCDEMATYRPRQPVYEIFSTKRRFQQSKSRPPKFKEAGAGERQKRLPL